MPAMSPTMTEGNIASWKVKEGDSFSTGDVLLEIETDKAQMDVEAQDDGKVAKILQEAGSRGVKVGTRIAVLAETDDNLSTLTLPAAESAPTPSPQESLSGIDASKSSESQAHAAPSSKTQDSPSMEPSKPLTPSNSSGKLPKQRYPLYPSITQLLHENGFTSSEADKIPASGPKGRLLKGDVLAYLGRISSTYSSEQSSRITKLGHLDLSNVKPAPSQAMASSQPSKTHAHDATELELEPTDTEVAIPVSLSSVISVQKRIQETLGVTLPISTFITRATELANDDLPHSVATKPTTDELFNDVLGLQTVSTKTSRGGYTPQVTALPTKPFTERAEPRRQSDVYDMLTRRSSTTPSTKSTRFLPPGIMAGSKTGGSTNVFSVRAAKGEEKRARVFLERVKTVLQVEPGRLVL